MKASAGFAFFLLFLGGFALVNLRSMSQDMETTSPSIEILSQNAWRPSHIGEMQLNAETGMFLQFNANGHLSGHGGCNTLFGNFQLNGAALAIDGIGMSRMACPDPVMSLEFSFVEALQAAASVAYRDGRLALRNEQGEATVRFDAVDRIE